MAPAARSIPAAPTQDADRHAGRLGRGLRCVRRPSVAGLRDGCRWWRFDATGGRIRQFQPDRSSPGRLRVANSRFENNADGRSFVNDETDVRTGRVGRGDNASGTIFVRGSQPVVVDNVFVDGSGPILSFDVNSFTAAEEVDYGRNTGPLDCVRRPRQQRTDDSRTTASARRG